MNVNLSEIPDAYQLPRPDWHVVSRWITENVPEANRPKAWSDIAGQWLENLNNALGDAYQIKQSEHFLLFAPRDSELADPLLRCGELGLTEIEGALGCLAKELQTGPIAILFFADNKTYGRFVTPFDSDLGFLRSTGVCFQEEYVHIAIRPGRLEEVQRTLLHELTHACLAHLTLPKWLEEGITQMAEEAVVPQWSQFQLSADTATTLKTAWRDHGLGEFWWGQAFSMEHHCQGYSYQLAEVLFRLLVSDHRRALPDFVRHAHRDDAGETAARQYLGKGLADLAEQFLGPGDWGPTPPDAASFCQRGRYLFECERYDDAIAELDEAIRLDPQSSDSYASRGLALSHVGRYAEAVEDFDRAIKLSPNSWYALNGLAWIRATCPEDEFRDGEQAVELSSMACELSAFDPWFCLGTMAASHAEVGDFEEAVRWARESLRLAPENDRDECRDRLKLYKSGQPYRDLPKPAQPAT